MNRLYTRLAGAALCSSVVMMTGSPAMAEPYPRDGILRVYGALVDGACRLDMTSQQQTVDLGSTPAHLLKYVGEQGNRVAFHIRLRDCLREAGTLTDTRTGNVSWSSSQPVVSVMFRAQTDVNNPELVAVQGGSGFGLRLSDERQRRVLPGQMLRPDFVTPESDTLTWYVTPERTAAPLTADAFMAMVDFTMSYE